MGKKTIYLEDIAKQMACCMDGWQHFLNTETGVFVELSDGMWTDYTERDKELADEIESLDVYVKLPNQYDLHEYDIMEEFAEDYPNAKISDRLLQILKRRTPSRNFKDAVIEMGIAQNYYDFRFQACCEKAARWCKDNRIPYAWKNETDGKTETESDDITGTAYEVIQIDAHTWRIEEKDVRFFLLEGTQKALLIDSGMQIHNAKEIAEGLTKLPVSLLNTHGDPDHVGSNAQFSSFYMHPAEASNYYNTQKRTGTFLPVENGDIIDLGGRPLEIISLPGHTPGSIAVLDKNNRALISGDPIQDGSIFMFGVHRELHAYIHSLEKLLNRRDAFDRIFPSHGSFPVKPDLIPILCAGAGRVLAGEVKGTDFEMFGHKVKRYDIGAAVFLCEP